MAPPIPQRQDLDLSTLLPVSSPKDDRLATWTHTEEGAQLDAVSEGETLVVVMCPKADVEHVIEPEIMRGVNNVIATNAALSGPHSTCRTQRFGLRP